MKNNMPQFDTLKALALSDSEKARMREALIFYANENPVIREMAAPAFSAFFASRAFSLYATMVAMLVVFGGGVTLAAEGSVPGETLYSLKVSVSEPVMTVLATSDEDKARLASKLAVRRLDEVAVLASTGRLTEEKQAELESSFDVHVEALEKHTATLAQKGDLKAAQALSEEFSVSLASEIQLLSTSKMEVSEKSRNLLKKVIALSSRDSGRAIAYHDEEGDDDDFTKGSATIALKKNGFVGTSSFLASSTATSRNASDASTTENGVRSGYRPRPLFLTASTSLSKILESYTPVPIRKDRPERGEDDGYSEERSDILKLED